MAKLPDRLLEAVQSPEVAAVVVNAALRPVGGEGAVVMPPTYQPIDKGDPYIREKLWLEGEGEVPAGQRRGRA